MSTKINAWKVYGVFKGEAGEVYDVFKGEAEVPLKSISHGISVLLAAASQQIGQTIYFEHFDRGLICCTAGRNQSTVRFAPGYDRRNESFIGSRSGRPKKKNKDLPHVDGNLFVSSIPGEFVLPILDVVRALVYILEMFDFPPFINWSDPLEPFDP